MSCCCGQVLLICSSSAGFGSDTIIALQSQAYIIAQCSCQMKQENAQKQPKSFMQRKLLKITVKTSDISGPNP